ncbi:ABC transporter permease [Glycomyces buryatensis]|uniref:ABC transporter permease n=1 Tax=Glycomyces buryatensis TaxID=2570927 RepID=A0A4S8QC52_9ACTN|nr:ABC transporter permease [Glycomyces buryatensis]THV38629.1 ABC transporter permease [Glycomyces buryatensis]
MSVTVDTRPTASQRQLVWWAFKKHRLALISAWLLAFMFFVIALCEFLAPFDDRHRDSAYTTAPPQVLKLWDTDGEEGFRWGLHVDGYTSTQDPESLRISYEADPDDRVEVGFFVKGEEYELFGLIPMERHFMGPHDPEDPMYLMGTTTDGQDLFSQLIYATRVSASVGVIGVLLAFILGIVLGAISGYFGGWADNGIQRVIELIMAVPAIPLWLGLTAALPVEMNPLTRYFIITTLLALVAWTGLAREVRGRFLAMRSEEFVTSARLDGSSHGRVMFRHMLPSFSSHIIAALSLSIPTMILAETALSWLGMGLRPPVVSWGVQLQDASKWSVLSGAPWLLIPGLCVVIVVLAFNFVGDGLRDAADPYKH